MDNIADGHFVSFSPTSMYHKSTSDPRAPYQPRGLGHFDPSMDVHTVTRPTTGSSLQLLTPPSGTVPVEEVVPTIRYSLTGDMEQPHSLFDCPHGCFSPHHNSPQCELHSPPNSPPAPKPGYSTSSPLASLFPTSQPPPALLYSSYTENNVV